MEYWQSAWSILAHLLGAYILAAVIGWNREAEEHNVGIRTFPIVCVASCGYLLILGPHPDVAAQSRVLQGLITGIGFVGGGAIVKEGANIRGAATAASVWNAAVIGAAVAINRYELAIMLTLLNLLTLRALLPLKAKLDKDKAGTSDPDGIVRP